MDNENIDKQFIISPSNLEGPVVLSGAKNSVLKLLTASLLTSETLTIHNYPSSLLDAVIQVGMLENLGKECKVFRDSIVIKENRKLKTSLKWEGRSIRSTLLILAALTTRFGFGVVPLPGGCNIGDRKYDLHMMILEKMGATVREEGRMLCAEVRGHLNGADIHLPLRSTGATESGIICGCLARGITRIWNPHVRPEIIDMIEMLTAMGADIKVYGQEHILVNGRGGLGGATHYANFDNMEALTWLIGAAITDGDVEIHNFPYHHLEVPLVHLRESGVLMYRCDDRMIVRGCKCYPLEISTGPYPGINSDMQPLLAVFAAKALGTSKIVDLRFFNRYGYAGELHKMGLSYEVIENTLIIHGGRRLQGARVKALDLRAGVALTMAGMAAEGETVVEDAWHVERGYDNFVQKLRSLGGRIEVLKNN